MSQVKKATAASYYLSEDLLMEITKRLPVKSILRCRCVRKSWYHLLRSPYFIALHSRHQNSLHKSLLFYSRDERYFSLRFDDEQCKEYCELQIPEDMKNDRSCIGPIVYETCNGYMKNGRRCIGPIVYETCNGLICLSCLWMKKVWLWNPALRVFEVLPDSPLPTNHSLTLYTNWGLAFGYLAKTNDYKVVKYERWFNDTESETEYYVYVYTLSTDSWKTVKKGKYGEFARFKVSNSVTVNGVAYWAASNLFWGRKKVIVCFDMENDTIREIRLPPPLYEQSGYNSVLVENSIFGELSMFYYDRSTYVLQIWELENAGDGNEVWTFKKCLDFGTIRSNKYSVACEPTGFRNNGEIVLGSGGKVMSCDLEKNEVKEIVDDDSLNAFYCNEKKRPYPHQGVKRFEETLILLDVNRQA